MGGIDQALDCVSFSCLAASAEIIKIWVSEAQEASLQDGVCHATRENWGSCKVVSLCDAKEAAFGEVQHYIWASFIHWLLQCSIAVEPSSRTICIMIQASGFSSGSKMMEFPPLGRSLHFSFCMAFKCLVEDFLSGIPTFNWGGRVPLGRLFIRILKVKVFWCLQKALSVWQDAVQGFRA